MAKGNKPQTGRMSSSEVALRVEAAEKLVCHSFSDKRLIVAALTHPSVLEDGHDGFSYERLEFLGDSVVGLIIAEEAFKRYPDIDEGGLTRIKIALVSGACLSMVSEKLGVADLILFGGSETGTGRRGLHSALENVYESITAALYLDGGMPVARRWVMRTLGPSISDEYAKVPESPKSTLQEVLQAQRMEPEYEVVGEAGPPHDRTFFVQVSVEGALLGTGSGRSKKDAEAAAALEAIEHLQGESARDGFGRDGAAAFAAAVRGDDACPTGMEADCEKGR